jgi:hypothetical protein
MRVQVIAATLGDTIHATLGDLDEERTTEPLARPPDTVVQLERRATARFQQAVFLGEVEMRDERTLHLLRAHILILQLQKERIQEPFKFRYCHIVFVFLFFLFSMFFKPFALLAFS